MRICMYKDVDFGNSQEDILHTFNDLAMYTFYKYLILYTNSQFKVMPLGWRKKI